MLRNYLKVAWRNVMAYKGYALINIMGLAIGLAVVVLITLYIRHETSYDKWVPEKENIYRVYRYWEDTQSNTVWTPSLLGAKLTETFPEVEVATGLGPHDEMLLAHRDKKLYVEDVARVDSTFFHVIGIPFLHGDPRTALDGPRSLVITESLAFRLFGSTHDAVGKIVSYDNQDGYMITGVVDLDDKLTHLNYDLFTRFTWYSESFTGNNRATYVKLNTNTQVAELESKITQLMRELIEQEYATINYTPTASDFAAWKLQSLSKVHLEASQYGWLAGPGGNVRHIYIFIVIALLVLSVAIVNYINLAISRAIKRKKEVGIRKVTGATRGQLMIQFIIEAILQSTLALVLAVALVQLLLPVFEQIIDRQLTLFSGGNAIIMIPALVLTILVGIIAGYYPAVQVSSYLPVRALKELTADLPSAFSLRKFLVSGQFVISIALLAVMAIVYRQIQYMQRHDLNFSADQVLVIPLNAEKSHDAVANLRHQFTSVPGVQSITTASRMPGLSFPDWGMLIEGQTENVNPRVLFTDHEFINTLDIDLVAGRFFKEDISADTVSSFVINEQYAREYGLTDPVGTRIKFTYDSIYGEIIGVIEDFHFQGLTSPIRPLVIGGMHNKWHAAIKLSTADLNNTLSAIKDLWAAVEPEHPMRYSFLDEDFNALYMEQKRFGKSLLHATWLTIFIALLGLIGLTAFAVQRRTKEIGIRKVLGASIPDIVRLISREFVLLVLIAFLIAAPLSLYVGNLWLQDFAFRTPVSWWIFAGAGTIVLLVVTITVSIQSFLAAIANPADALRNE